MFTTLWSLNFRLCKPTFYTENLFFHDRCVHLYKDFNWHFPKRVTRDKWKLFISDSAVLSLTPWWDAHRRVKRYNAHPGSWLWGVTHTAKFFEKRWPLDSAVWCTRQSLTPLWDANHGLHGHRGVRLCSLFPLHQKNICFYKNHHNFCIVLRLLKFKKWCTQDAKASKKSKTKTDQTIIHSFWGGPK